MGAGASVESLTGEDKAYYTDVVSHKNAALVFIKPHANNDKVQALVSQVMNTNEFSIAAEGEILSSDIDSKRLIDNHYYSIASKATLMEPKDLPVPADIFESFFGITFADALAQGSVYNALQAAEYLELNAQELEAAWERAKAQRVKFGGGFYAAKLSDIDGKQPIYVFNAFFMAMRGDFVKPNTSIHYYVIEWDPTKTNISWAQFRSDILGATNPTQSIATSLRGQIMAQWQELGLSEPPSTGKNGVHGSASPLEGLGERVNWLNANIEEDSFGKSLMALGVPLDTISSWCKDLQIEGVGSVFDFFEDTNVDDCYLKAKQLHQEPLPNRPMKEPTIEELTLKEPTIEELTLKES